MSCAAKTPIISTSISRNAAMYSPTRVSIASQLAPMQIGIRKTESMMSMRAMPSMPSAQLKRSNKAAFSTNCHCAPPISKFIHSTMPSARSTSVASSAIQRAALALTNRHATAAAIGTASISDRIGKPSSFMSAHHQPGQRGHKAHQHHQRITVEKTRLQLHRHAAARRDQNRRPIGTEAVDRALVADLPEEAAQREARLDEDVVVQFVEIPLVEEEPVE